MAETYITLSSLKHYDEKIKEVIDDKQEQLVGAEGQIVSFDADGNVISKDLEKIEIDTSDFVTKEEGKGLFSGSYNDLTDKPEIPSTDGLASEDYVDEKIDALIGEGASTTLDTIGEISKAIEEHQDVTDALNSAIGNKVDKVSGKGLSTNDLTSTLKSNYDSAYTHSQSTHAPATAEKNVIVGIQKNGTDLSVNSSTRKVNITVPTKTSELTNDSNFKTTDNNTTYSLSKSGSTITLTGSDGSTTSVADSNTTYSNFVKSGSSAKAGLVPAPSTTAGTSKYLREDGTWTTPPDTKYTLPTASSTLGGVKTTSTVTSTSGLTACPIISGVPYYKDTNTTYSLGSFGITATAAELNYTDGVTSNIQTQLNNKLSTSGGTVTGDIKAMSTTGAPATTIGTSCSLSGGMVKTSPGGNTEITYGVKITDPSDDGSRATINGYKILHEGNMPAISSSNIAVPFDTELVFGTKGTSQRGFIKATANSLLIKAPTSSTSGSSKDYGGAGLKFSYCSAGILPYYSLNTASSMNLGSSSLKFGTIYSAASALNSDVKLKKDIESLSDESDKYLKTFDELDFVRFRWAQNMNGGLATPASSRYHLGLIAQEVEKTFENNGIEGSDSGAIQANFFADNTSEAWITGGFQAKKEGYDYSENVWNYKHDLEYEWINEIIEKPFSELNGTNGYSTRPNIQYIMFEDISKVAAEGKQPPLKVNGITLVNNDDEYIELELTENGISYYDHDNDTELTIPLSNATLNEDGTLTINFNKMWSSYMLEVPTFAFADYKTLILDIDYIGEYKCYLIPEGEIKNANVWDRGNNDKILYDYSLNYNEIYALSLYALQETRKEYTEYKATTEATINELTEKVNLLLEKVGE